MYIYIYTYFEERALLSLPSMYMAMIKKTHDQPPCINYYPPGTFPPPHKPMILARLSDISKKNYRKKHYSKTAPIKNC